MSAGWKQGVFLQLDSPAFDRRSVRRGIQPAALQDAALTVRGWLAPFLSVANDSKSGPGLREIQAAAGPRPARIRASSPLSRSRRCSPTPCPTAVAPVCRLAAAEE